MPLNADHLNTLPPLWPATTSPFALTALARRATALQRRRDRLAGKVAALDEQIREMGGGRNGVAHTLAPRGRPHNEKNLAQSLRDVLMGKKMKVTDLAQAVLAAGYRTSGRTFRTQVNIALIKNPKLFRRVGRGEYTAK